MGKRTTRWSEAQLIQELESLGGQADEFFVIVEGSDSVPPGTPICRWLDNGHISDWAFEDGALAVAICQYLVGAGQSFDSVRAAAEARKSTGLPLRAEYLEVDY